MTPNIQQPASPSPSGRGALRPKARLLRTLGSDLISSDKVALIELVKNSYDADARIVVIRFHGPLVEGAGRIEVWDDGNGMDADTLQRSWLDIATDVKRKSPRSAGGRRVLGEKGIGRLAAARLGDEMLLVTRMLNADEVKLLIDWTDFDREEAYLDEIEVAWEVGAPDVFSDTGVAFNVFSGSETAIWNQGRGTVLQIDRLSRAWNRDDVLELRTALMRLIRPQPGRISDSSRDEAVEPEFQVILELFDVEEELQDLAGSIEPSSELQTPHYSLSGTVNNEGVATLHYTQKYPPLEECVGSKQLWSDARRSPKAGPFEFQISVWDLDNAAIMRMLQDADAKDITPSTKDLKGFRDTLGEVAGISIYRDGFRVLPFGESGDDWLGLDLRRVQAPTRRVSNNQVIGHVFIGADTNKGLKDQSNREGILAGEAYSDLQSLVKSALAELEVRRYVARRQDNGKRERKGGLFDRFDLGEVRAAMVQSYPSDKRVIALLDDKHRDIQLGVTEIQNVLSQYSRLATLGALIDRVLHDGRTVVARLKNIARFGKRDLRKKGVVDSNKIAIAVQAMDDTTAQAELLSSLFKQIEPFGGRKRGRPKTIGVEEVVDKAFSILRQDAEEGGVDLVRTGDSVAVKLDEAELLTVLVNLIQNSIYWTSTQPKGVERKVIVSIEWNEDSSLSIVVSDSGPGVAHGVQAHIFDPYFSTKPEGVGLGLSIAGNIVENIYDGKLVLVHESQLGGATFKATFRRRVR